MSTPQESKSKGPPHAKSSDDALLGAGVEEMQRVNLHQRHHLAAESGRIVRIHLPLSRRASAFRSGISPGRPGVVSRRGLRPLPRNAFRCGIEQLRISPTHRRALAVATVDIMRVPWVMLLLIACGRAAADSTPDLADAPMDAGSSGSGPTGDAGFSDAGVDAQVGGQRRPRPARKIQRSRGSRLVGETGFGHQGPCTDYQSPAAASPRHFRNTRSRSSRDAPIISSRTASLRCG